MRRAPRTLTRSSHAAGPRRCAPRAHLLAVLPRVAQELCHTHLKSIVRLSGRLPLPAPAEQPRPGRPFTRHSFEAAPWVGLIFTCDRCRYWQCRSKDECYRSHPWLGGHGAGRCRAQFDPNEGCTPPRRGARGGRRRSCQSYCGSRGTASGAPGYKLRSGRSLLIWAGERVFGMSGLEDARSLPRHDLHHCLLCGQHRVGG
jgi:hypothetical protein